MLGTNFYYVLQIKIIIIKNYILNFDICLKMIDCILNRTVVWQKLKLIEKGDVILR